MKGFMFVGLVLVLASLAGPAAQAAILPEYCHAGGITECLGGASVAGSDFGFEMSGTDSLAQVEAFEAPSKSRNVLWSNFVMSGLTEEGGEISASLDPSRRSSGIVLSVGNTEFPATATMRFFLRLETGGMTLVSNKPAVFQGIIHSIPPGPGDALSLISGPVKFHEEGGSSRVVVGTLNKSNVVFRESSASLPANAQWGMAGFGAILLVSGGLYVRRRTLAAA